MLCLHSTQVGSGERGKQGPGMALLLMDRHSPWCRPGKAAAARGEPCGTALLPEAPVGCAAADLCAAAAAADAGAAVLLLCAWR